MNSRRRVFKALGYHRLALAVLVVLVSFLGLAVLSNRRPPFFGTGNVRTSSPEIRQILRTNNLTAQVKIYKQLISRVGPVEAQEQLAHAGLQYDGNSHLLNHVVGDYIYEKYGDQGMVYCRDYFSYSCYHGVLLHAFGAGNANDHITAIMAACWARSKEVAMQCSHAIGHGFLAWVGYENLPKALDLCENAGNNIPTFTSYNCLHGAFMENRVGVHDGMPSPNRWFNAADPYFPCDDKRIADRFQNACWTTQPQIMLEIFNNDVVRVGKICDTLGASGGPQAICFDSVARKIVTIANGKLPEVITLCNKMPDAYWANSCIGYTAIAMYRDGDRKGPFELCARAGDNSNHECYAQLYMIANRIDDSLTKEAFCHNSKQYDRCRASVTEEGQDDNAQI